MAKSPTATSHSPALIRVIRVIRGCKAVRNRHTAAATRSLPPMARQAREEPHYHLPFTCPLSCVSCLSWLNSSTRWPHRGTDTRWLPPPAAIGSLAFSVVFSGVPLFHDCTYHRDYRAGWFLPCRIAAEQRLSGSRHRPSQHIGREPGARRRKRARGSQWEDRTTAVFSSGRL